MLLPYSPDRCWAALEANSPMHRLPGLNQVTSPLPGLSISSSASLGLQHHLLRASEALWAYWQHPRLKCAKMLSKQTLVTSPKLGLRTMLTRRGCLSFSKALAQWALAETSCDSCHQAASDWMSTGLFAGLQQTRLHKLPHWTPQRRRCFLHAGTKLIKAPCHSPA